MTPKQQKFADKFIELGNKTEAAIKAGYSPKTAYSIGNENMKKPEIKAYIDKQLNGMHSETVASGQDVLEFLTKIMNGEKTESVVTNKGIVKGVEVSAKDRIKAAELIGKRHSLFTDKVEQTNTNIEIDVGDWSDDDE